MQDFKQLNVWSKSHQLTLELYRITKDFPDEGKYGLVSQIRRSCSSIPTNIAEGSGRNSKNGFSRFLHIAMGSASEVEYQLLLSAELKYVDNVTYKKLNKNLIEIKKMLSGLIKKLAQS